MYIILLLQFFVMKDRIKKFMNKKRLTAAELADTIGVQRSNVSHIINGRNNPSSSFIDKLLQHFPDLDARWLITGIGNMSNDITPDSSLFAQESNANKPIEDKPSVNVGNENMGNQHVNMEKEMNTSIKKEVEKIIILYKDKSFDVY